MSNVVVQPVIMAGGSGTRLWPLSRAGFPKQFLAFGDTHSLFQLAVARAMELSGDGISVAAPLIVTNEEHRFLALDQLRELRVEPAALVLEPEGRNTAPAVALAAAQAQMDAQDPVLVVLPADQAITNADAFRIALRRAVSVAAAGGIAILGVPPTRAETGFGYIRTRSDATERSVVQFVEKPNTETALEYLKSGEYFWNAGMFVMRASVWLKALTRFRADIAQACDAAFAAGKRDGVFVRPCKAAFAQVPAESVDYAVMERCPGSEIDIRMVPLDAGWSDLGAWDAVWQTAAKDEQDNVTIGDVILQDSKSTLVHASSRLVGVVGLEDVVVVETPDAVLVADRSRSQEVKAIVGRLGREQRGEHALHRKVHRPWGWYDSIDQGERFQVKRIMVKPGAALSLQMHHHRAEHWIVVSGTAEVQVGEATHLLSENQSIYIPLGEKHRLVNPGRLPLELIEVQSGSYLGEDDIVRFQDTYGRA